MDNRGEIKAFLSSRRAKITPEQAGLTAYARNRRVPGLRRSEVADLAGVSVEYYAQLERGDLSGVSDSVLEALARALQLDEAEHAHLLDLARAAGLVARTRCRTPAHQVRPTIQRLLDLMTEVPVIVNNARLDPYDQGLTGLVGELSTRSEAFRIRWAAHNVRLHRTGLKHFHHPVVGDLHLNFEVMELPADPGLSLLAFSADAGSPDDDALHLLASWAATHDPAALRHPPRPEAPISRPLMGRPDFGALRSENQMLNHAVHGARTV
jgi:transcriptional regulator with XRE-family HTH domain